MRPHTRCGTSTQARLIRTSTNVADEREYYGPDAAPGPVHWRVRAVREIYNSVSSGVPAASHGPWSPVYTSDLSAFATGAATPRSAASDIVSTSRSDGSHHLMPGFAFDGATSLTGEVADGYRVYVATDKDCVNIVFRGDVVSSPAYAPRVFDVPFSGIDSATSPTANARRDLWDNDWTTGGYYWTVVAVADADSAAGGRELDVPQDACTSGRVGTFRRTSDPAVTSKTHVPYAAGLSPGGRLLAATGARPRFYGTPLVSWQPALAATSYEVQWSKTSSFARVAGRVKTRATSAMLPLDARHMVVPGARPQPRCRRRVYGDELVACTGVARRREADVQSRRLANRARARRAAPRRRA